MAIPSAVMLREMVTHGTGVQMVTGELVFHVPLADFFHVPERGERNPWPDRVYFPWEPYDDGGGATIAAYQFGRCPFAQPQQRGHAVAQPPKP